MNYPLDISLLFLKKKRKGWKFRLKFWEPRYLTIDKSDMINLCVDSFHILDFLWEGCGGFWSNSCLRIWKPFFFPFGRMMVELGDFGLADWLSIWPGGRKWFEIRSIKMIIKSLYFVVANLCHVHYYLPTVVWNGSLYRGFMICEIFFLYQETIKWWFYFSWKIIMRKLSRVEANLNSILFFR